MEKLPEDVPAKAKYAKLFREFNNYLQAARIQGFRWDKEEYIFSKDSEDGEILNIQEGKNALEEIKEIDYLAEIEDKLLHKKEKGNHCEIESSDKELLICLPTEDTFRILEQRYKELRKKTKDSEDGEVTFPIDPYLTEENTGVIDHEYMNSRFEKWKKVCLSLTRGAKIRQSLFT